MNATLYLQKQRQNKLAICLVLLSQGIALVLYITAKFNVLSAYNFTESTTKHTSQTHMWHVVF
jgi:hypothetical protein